MRVTEGPSGYKDGEEPGWENASSAASRFGRRTSQQQEKLERAPRQDCAWLGNNREARGATAKRVSGRGQRRSLGRWASRNPDKGVGAQTHPCRAKGVNKSGSVHTAARYKGITIVFTKDT